MPSKGKSKSRESEWSDWVWDSERAFYYRYRLNAEGEYEYDYAPQSSDESRSRSKDPVEEITRGVERLSSGDDTSREQQRSRSYADERGYDAYPSRGQEGYATGDTYYQDAYGASGSSSRPAYTREDEPYSTAAPAQETYRASGTSSRPVYTTPDETYSTAAPGYGYGSYPEADPAYSGQTYGAYGPVDDDGRSTPKPRREGQDSHITADMAEALDPRYRLERSDRFQPGEIFKVGWAEPKGSAKDNPTISGKEELRDTRGVTFITGFRRFIVIANDLGHSTCVPISSYMGQACTKRGSKPEKHGIIFQGGQRPKLLEKEPKLGFAPVKVEITMEGERLSKASRANYSKLVTVEHNVKVMFIGSIVPNDWPIVTDAIDRCWEDKDRQKKKSRHRR